LLLHRLSLNAIYYLYIYLTWLGIIIPSSLYWHWLCDIYYYFLLLLLLFYPASLSPWNMNSFWCLIVLSLLYRIDVIVCMYTGTYMCCVKCEIWYIPVTVAELKNLPPGKTRRCKYDDTTVVVVATLSNQAKPVVNGLPWLETLNSSAVVLYSLCLYIVLELVLVLVLGTSKY
jgi:hypothetical protein